MRDQYKNLYMIRISKKKKKNNNNYAILGIYSHNLEIGVCTFSSRFTPHISEDKIVYLENSRKKRALAKRL